MAHWQPMRRMTARGRGWMAGALLALSGAVGLAQSAPVERQCADAVAAQRREWGAASAAISQPSIAPDDWLQHWPTTALGVWLVERTTGTESTLTRVSPDGLVRVRWSSTCTPTRDERPRVPATQPAFTDRDLGRTPRSADARRPLPVVAAHAVVGRRLRRAAPRGRGEAARGRGAARSAVRPGIRRGVGQRGAAAAGGPHGRRFGGAAVSRAAAACPGNRGLRATGGCGRRCCAAIARAEEYGAFFDRVLAK